MAPDRLELLMNTQRVWFAFFIVLALTLNFGFFVGEIDNPHHHNQINNKEDNFADAGPR